MSTLLEISEQYDEAAVPIRNKLRKLREDLKKTEDPQERAGIKHDLATLGAILTELNMISDYTRFYYERKYVHSDHCSTNVCEMYINKVHLKSDRINYADMTGKKHSVTRNVTAKKDRSNL